MDSACWCESGEYTTLLAGSWDRYGGSDPLPLTVRRCRECGLARTDPTPNEDRYGQGESIWAAARLHDQWSDKLAKRLLGRAPGRRILDIGCNVGNLVEAAARSGADAEGIDLDPVAIERGRTAGRNVHLRDIADQTGEWDGIALNHVLEHVVDLSGFLGHVERLAGSGAVIMINVPCYEGVIPRMMGERWFAWAPDEHVWHFTPKTLRRVVESSTSLTTLAARRRGLIEPPSDGLKGRTKSMIGRLASRANRGDQVEALFRKPG
jgi:SAM-dependent methyltransferase